MLKGKTAIVTGGVRGIGKTIALALVEKGVNVALCYGEMKMPLKLPRKK